MRINREMTRKEYELFLVAGDPYSQADWQLTYFDKILTAVKRLSLKLNALPQQERMYEMLLKAGVKAKPEELKKVMMYVYSRRIYREWEKE
jgi:Txe/YoeB family toxin of Txe-Axe toxin-antitoxin module